MIRNLFSRRREGRPSPRWAWMVGAALAVGLVTAAGETYLRWFPPADIDQHLGEKSSATGPYVRDERFGAQYQDWATFAAANAERLAPHLPLSDHPDPRPVWALFGNSFVHAQEMLGDQIHLRLPQRRAFYLGRNELLFVRCAQIALLLENGLRPERIIFALMPLDTAVLGRQPLASLRVTPRGGLAYRTPEPPAPLGAVVGSTRLGLTGWLRLTQPASVTHGNSFSRRLHRQVPPGLLADLDHLFCHLAAAARAVNVPVTVLLIPTHHQVINRAGFAFQDRLTPMLRGHGLDVCDPRSAFVNHADRPGLFIPDLHFSPAGNQILYQALMDHLAATEQLPADLPGGGR